MRSLLLSLFKAQADLPSYSVTLEATHHGPTEMNVPVSFVEIGSSEDQWKDAEAGFLVAKAIWEAISKPLSGLPAVGFGGKHYSATFTKAVLERGVAMGHIVPKYAVEGVNEEIVRQAVRKTEGCRCAVLDWDGLRGEQRRKLTTLLKREGLDVIKV
jgi:D-aminoacyl-tRNA deacylase